MSAEENQCAESTENRAITIRQLREIKDEIVRRCEPEGWTSTNPAMDGELLTPKTINLYDLNEMLIKPKTVFQRCSTIKWKACTSQPHCRREVINAALSAALAHRTEFTLVEYEVFSVEPVSHKSFIRAGDAYYVPASGCSYVDLVASGQQPPKWFVSHWWGHSVLQFISCLEQHATDHGLSDETAYWVCAYANNQHDVAADVTADPSQSSFVKAIKLAEGRVVTIVDAEGITYERIWCCLEISLGLSQTYEVYTYKEGCEAYDMTKMSEIRHMVEAAGFGKIGEAHWEEVWKRLPVISTLQAVGITFGACKADEEHAMAQVRRQSSFPIDLIHFACKIKIQAAKSTVASDRVHILNFIAGRQGVELEATVLEECKRYQETNTMLHSAFIAPGWRLLLEAGEEMETYGHTLVSSHLTKLYISFRNCTAFDDEASQLFLRSLPTTIEELQIEQADSSQTIVGRRAMLDGLLERLELPRLRHLSLSGCGLTGRIPECIGLCIKVEFLRFTANQLTGEIPECIGRCSSLVDLRAAGNELAGTIPAALGQCTELEVLILSSNRLTGEIPAELGNCTKLKDVRLNNNQLTGLIPASLTASVGLQKLRLKGNQIRHPIPASLVNIAEC